MSVFSTRVKNSTFQGQPQSDLWQDVQSGQVPTHYGIQVQHQLMVSGAALAHLWVFDGNQGILHAIEPDATVMEQIQAGWDNFEQYLTGDGV